MPSISLSKNLSCSIQSDVKFLLDSLAKKSPISPERAVTLSQINTLHYAGLIPSEEAFLIKNNLSHPDDLLYSEGILSELILKQIKEGKLAPEMKTAVSEYGLEKTIFLLYTSHLEQTYSTLEPYIIQQQILKTWKRNPLDLFLRTKEAEAKESKKYVKEWIASIKPTTPEMKDALAPLLKPLTERDFKEHFLRILTLLQEEEQSLIDQLRLEEITTLLKKQPETHFQHTLANILKAFRFYQNHIEDVKKASPKSHQFSLCLASDAIKNAPFAKELATAYHSIYGQIKKAWEEKKTSLQKIVTLIEGPSLDEQAIGKTVRTCLETIKKPFHSIRPMKELTSLIQTLLKKAPEMILGAVSEENQPLLFQAAKALHLPIAFFSPHAEIGPWEETINDPYKQHQIVFPFPVLSNSSDSITREKTSISGIPGLFHNTLSKKELREKWNIAPEIKVVVIDAPEGNSPWPEYIAKNYTKNILLLVVTDPKHRAFIHSLKTNIAPRTDLPLKVYTSISSLEREELFTLSDLVISKERKESSSLLFETWNAKTPVLLDDTPSTFLEKVFSFFTLFQDLSETTLHENLLNEENLGLMIRSKKNFKLAFEELLYEEHSISSPSRLQETLSSLLPLLKPSPTPRKPSKSPLGPLL